MSSSSSTSSSASSESRLRFASERLEGDDADGKAEDVDALPKPNMGDALDVGAGEPLLPPKEDPKPKPKPSGLGA